jgi:hypothetical protein
MKTKQSETLLSSEYISSLIRKRKPSGHKGTFGHALIVAGSTEKTGAAILSSTAALKKRLRFTDCCYTHIGCNALDVQIAGGYGFIARHRLRHFFCRHFNIRCDWFWSGRGHHQRKCSTTVSYFISTPTTFGDRCRWNYSISAEQRLVRIVETQYYPNATCWRI